MTYSLSLQETHQSSTFIRTVSIKRDVYILRQAGINSSIFGLYHAETGACYCLFRGHTSTVTCCSTYTNAQGEVVIVSGSQDRSLRRWDAEKGRPIGQALRLPERPVAIICELGQGQIRVLLCNGNFILLKLRVPSLAELAAQAVKNYQLNMVDLPDRAKELLTIVWLA